MYRNPDFTQTTLSNAIYLLPTGQGRSDLKNGIRINETGACIWSLLQKDRSLTELLSLAEEQLGISPEESDNFRQGVLSFLDDLAFHGLLLDTPAIPRKGESYYMTLSIAGLTINFFGPQDAFSSEFASFSYDYTETPDQTVLVLYGSPAAHENGKVLVRNPELTVMELSGKYILLFHQDSCIKELHLEKDASLVTLYCIPNSDRLVTDVFHALRFSFLYMAQEHGILAIHSASVLYRERAWLFSAPAGTGKSTHAALWNRLADAPLINGDLNLIALENGHPVVHGLPWCGTSGIFDTHSYELGGIIFLKQAPTDSIEQLAGEQRILSLTNRLISPVWDGPMLERQLAFAAGISETLFMCRLHCTEKPSALALIRTEIDGYLNT